MIVLYSLKTCTNYLMSLIEPQKYLETTLKKHELNV